MAEVSKNNKILKFEVSARLDKNNDTVSLFATDHDFAGLPFKVNILNTSNTHNSILSVMDDYGMDVSDDLVNKNWSNDKDHSSNSASSIPGYVDYPENPLSAGKLAPLGVGEGGRLVHIELPDFLLIEGGAGSGKTVLINTIIQAPQEAHKILLYVNNRETLEKANRSLFAYSRQNPSASVRIISDGFEDLCDNESSIVDSLHVLSNLVYSMPNAHCVFSVQKSLGAVVDRLSNRGVSVQRINMGKKDTTTRYGEIILGRGFGDDLFVNGEKADDVEFQTYLTEKDWVGSISM